MAEGNSTSAALERPSPTQYRFHYYAPGVKWRVSPHTSWRAFEFIGTAEALSCSSVIDRHRLPGASGKHEKVTKGGFFWGYRFIARKRRDGTFSVTREAAEYERWEKKERPRENVGPAPSTVARAKKIDEVSDMERWMINCYRNMSEFAKKFTVESIAIIERTERKTERAARAGHRRASHG